MPHLRRVLLALTASLPLAALAGCGDDGGSGSSAAPSTAAESSTTTAESATSTSTSTTTTTTAPTTTEAPAPGATVIAHRGASAYAPEHTFAAYDLALDMGADYIEQDLQLTADGELVVLHDPTLERTVRGPIDACTGAVADKTVAELRTCDAGTWFNEAYPDLADPSFAELRIPTLREVLRRYGTDVRYYIETKAPEEQPGMEEALVDLLDEMGIPAPGDDGGVIIQSFSPASLELLHSLRPELPLVLLWPARPDDALLDAATAYATGIGPTSEAVDAALVRAAHERCLIVHPYTVDDPAEMRRLLDAGVDGMFTNVPDRLLEVRDRHEPPEPPCEPEAAASP